MVTNCAPFCRAQNAATAALSVIRLIAEGYSIESRGAKAPGRRPKASDRLLFATSRRRLSRQ
jgi:hypothetical protein